MNESMGEGPNAKIRRFWDAEACGERYGGEQERVRYELEPEIIDFANFGATRDKRVLEVGVGMGADFVRFIRAGAVAVGVDLTPRAVALTNERLAREGLSADVHVADAEDLPFADGAFEMVYSWGVLHHSAKAGCALRECCRVLAPGGQLRVMLYHRHSWVALAAWVRFCALRGKLLRNLADAVAHIESPGTRAFTAEEIAPLLPGLADLQVRSHLTHWDRRWAPGIARLLGDRFGWFLLISGRKPLVGDADPRPGEVARLNLDSYGCPPA